MCPPPLLLAVGVVLAATGAGCQHAPEWAEEKRTSPAVEPVQEPKAIDLLKAASARLAAARTLTFTAVISYEIPSRFGPPLVHTTKSEVALQRPDKLRVITPGDGPAQEFYYDGKTMTSFSPAEDLVAIAPAPPTIDATLEAAYHSAAIYFPFADVIVADPYKDIAEGLELAFYIGQSIEVGGTPTDMVAYATNGVFVQAWIGAEDHLPRRLRALYRDDPAQLRHDMELSNWQLDPVLPPNTFTSSRAPAKRISFIPRQAGQAKGTHLRAIRASVRDIFRLWVKWNLKRGLSRRRGTVRRLVRTEWPSDAISC